MKKLVVMMGLSVLFMGLSNLCNAQIAEPESKWITRDEVPASVQKSLKDNFSISPGDGTWAVNYSKYGIADHRPTLEVESYTFSQKKDGEKIKIVFGAKGKIENTHNIARNTSERDTSG